MSNKDELLIEYKPLVSKIARKYFLIGAEVEDIIQEGMIGLYKAIESYDPTQEASLKTFATLCINRQIQTAIKKSNNNKNRFLNEIMELGIDDEERINSLVSTEPNPEEQMLNDERYKFIVGEINKKLSRLEKQILNCYLEGYSYDKIAKILDIDKKSVDNGLNRIRKKLSYLLD